MELYADKSSMRQTARRLEEECMNFQEATENYISATEALLATWEGDAQMKFSIESEINRQLLEQMLNKAKLYYRAIDKAVKAYTETDSECASILRNA